MMRTQSLFTLLFGAFLAVMPIGADDHKAAVAPVAGDTLTGEVVDLSCYLGHGGQGKDHAKCAKQCLKKGLPVGLLTEKGEAYLAVGPNHGKVDPKLIERASETVTVVGKITEKSGMKMIEVAQVVPAKKASAAIATPAPEAVVYACPMHPDVKQAGPGICPKCGMALEKAAK